MEFSQVRVGLYPGSFDPVTYGHVDIVRRAAHLVDKLVIAIGTHHDKHPLFTAAERVKLTSEVLNPVAKEIGLKLEVTTYDNLTVDAAKDAKATVVIRGLRDAGDFDYEMQMAGMNQALAPEIETVFLASSPEARHIAASLVRQIAAMDGDVSSFVPAAVNAARSKNRPYASANIGNDQRRPPADVYTFVGPRNWPASILSCARYGPRSSSRPSGG